MTKKPREYCCCAVPLVNAGIYATLAEQFLIALVVGTLSIATPAIVGAATPSFAPALLAVFCYVAAAIQILGFVGVAREKPIMYRRYVTLHTGATILAFAIAAAWIVISATRHSTAISNCVATYFPGSNASDNTSSEGQTLCDIFSWVDIGLMVGSWIFFALVHTYFLFVVSSYGSSQREDHTKYEVLNDSTRPPADDIPMADRSDPWDSRVTYDTDGHRGRGQDSVGSTVVGTSEGHATYNSRLSRSPDPQRTRYQSPLGV